MLLTNKITAITNKSHWLETRKKQGKTNVYWNGNNESGQVRNVSKKIVEKTKKKRTNIKSSNKFPDLISFFRTSERSVFEY